MEFLIHIRLIFWLLSFYLFGRHWMHLIVMMKLVVVTFLEFLHSFCYKLIKNMNNSQNVLKRLSFSTKKHKKPISKHIPNFSVKFIIVSLILM